MLDDTQPRNTAASLQHERPDVMVIDGGIAAVPGITIRGDIGLPRGQAYACLCETMLMAFDGQQQAATGQASTEHAIRMRDAARRFAHLGFTLADPPLSFGRPVALARFSLPRPRRIRADRRRGARWRIRRCLGGLQGRPRQPEASWRTRRVRVTLVSMAPTHSFHGWTRR